MDRKGRKNRKGVVPPQLRPFLFKAGQRGGGGGGGGRRVRVGVPATLGAAVKRGLTRLGGAGRIYYVVNAGKELQIVEKAKNAIKGGTDEAIGQLGLLWTEATDTKASAVFTPVLVVEGGKWICQKLGVSVPEWLA